tara:strand:+ start:386 stop:682 length:297 start_codon:yes stop_codon:yes gene_type:complete
MFDDTLEDENIFGWVGLKDNGSHYVSATGLYDYFWSIKQETREKILEGWITALEAYLDPDFEKRLEDIEDGIIYVSESSESVEDKPTDNIIPFPKIIR